MAQLLVNAAYLFAITSLIACSFFFSFKPTGYFNVAHAIAILLAAYVVASFPSASEAPRQLAGLALLALVAATLFGLAVDRLQGLIPVSRDKPVYVLVLSLGIYVLFQNIFAIAFGENLRRASLCGGCNELLVQREGLTLSWNQAALGVMSLAGVAILIAIWYATSLGRAARAIAENRELAEILGVDTRKTISLLTGIGAAAAGLAGIAIAFDAGVTPSSGLSYLLPGLTAVIIGGNRTVMTTVAGAAVVAAIQTSTAYFLGSKWDALAVYSLFIAVLIVRPAGLFSDKTRLR